jgi:carbon-monoxide dehydrogenase large subunit
MTLGATKYVGQRVPRREDPRFLTGRTRYVDDIRLPRMVHAAFVRTPYPHAEVRGFRTERARAHRGVVAVLTAEEAARLASPIRADLRLPEWKSSEFPILGWPRVRFAGEAVAVVAAADRYLAEDAAELVEVDYDPLPAVTDVERAVEPGSPLIHAHWGDNLFMDRWKKAGDAADAFAQAELVWQRTYRTHRHTGYPMEGRACLADFQRETGTLTFYAATQIPYLIRTQLADLLRLPEHAVRVVAPDVGGGFGIKAHLSPEEVAVALLSMRLGRPVKWIEDAREHLLASNHAHEHTHRVQAAMRRDGTILGLRVDVLVDCGAYSIWPETAGAEPSQAPNVLPGLYRIRHYEARTRAVATNKCPIGAYRGVGRPAATFTMERLIEDVARELGIDAVEIRRRNYIRDDQFPYTSVTGLEYDSASPMASLEKAVEAIDYEAFRREQARARTEGRYLGVGFGSFIEQTAHTTVEYARRGQTIVRGYETVSVALDPSGTVVVEASTHSHGQGHETSFAQIVADRLGVPLEAIRVRCGDTASLPYGMGTFASRSAVVAGGAAWKAAESVRRALLKIAGHVMEVSPDDLEIAAGTIRVKGSPTHRMTVAEVTRLAYHRSERLPPGVSPIELASTQTYDAPPGTGTFTNAIHAALVEVDIATGFVRILRYVVVEDCGVMINPLIVDGQVHGGVAQGIGGALYEHLVYDETGQMLSQTLVEYLLPSALEVPPIEVYHIETPSFTLGGFKGAGEGGAIAPLAALGNAVSDALAPLGVTVDATPLAPERILALVAQAGAAGAARTTV